MFAILRFILPIGAGVGQNVITDSISRRLKKQYANRTVLYLILAGIALFFIF